MNDSQTQERAQQFLKLVQDSQAEAFAYLLGGEVEDHHPISAEGEDPLSYTHCTKMLFDFSSIVGSVKVYASPSSMSLVIERSDGACLDFLKEFLNVSMGILKNKLNYEASAFFLPTQTRQYHDLFFDDTPRELFHINRYYFSLKGAGMVVELWSQFRDEEASKDSKNQSSGAEKSVEFL